ncbi:hypothetical protein [Microbulbifer spongiae]|uniref:Tetratricopeptide repeat protein n=1 Tax=Microbulbifer spongiae TaxID=2944933 RepID=A0ABY9EA32_9GAMM|nr:hypothetical protein [Microbulbifer sp. MI-G]WKD49211.1 hypothetical protein M8T91_15105 [Microbulbifer sp. MI-G]
MQPRNNSKEDSAPIEPAEFTFGGERAHRPENPIESVDNNQRRRTHWPTAIGVVLLCALVGVFWGLPRVVDKPQLRLGGTDKISVKAGGPTKSNQASPYSDAEIMQQRRSVQETLQDILALKEELLERRVEVWALEEFTAAEGLALEADGIYRNRQFLQALEKYREALQALQSLRESIPDRLEKHITEGNQALEKGNRAAAVAAFQLVLTISEHHPRGLKGLERADRLPLAWWNFIHGKAAYLEGNLDLAKNTLQKALSVDTETAPAKVLLKKVLEEITERNYQDAMSAGYAAIAGKRYASAKKYFTQAQKLKPDAKAPGIGLTQAHNGAERDEIDRLFHQARKQENREAWHAALLSYTTLVKKDASLVAAITGKARATARAQLDDKLQDLLKDPLTLGEQKRNSLARQVLADARTLNAQTPRLQQQIKDLEHALTQAMIPLPVRFKSDSSTHVTIYHVGRLGIFDRREIALKPGRYTAVGTREGYRDVRREFIVVPGKPVTEIVIQCADKINGVNNS